MYDLKWFKFDLWTFDRAEFKYIESCEGGPMFLYYWVRLLSEAAKLNDGGRVYVFKNSKIDFSELAILLRSDEETMTRAIFLYDSLGLITYNAEAGLVIKNWSSYIGDNARADSDGARESEYADGARKLEYTDGEEESLRYGAERAPEKSREEIARERNREAQRKWRERQREKRSAEKNGSNKEEKLGDNSVTQSDNKHNAESNDSTVLRNESRNESVILRNAESNITDNESNNYGNGNSPKNIFIEENREEKEIDKIRVEENREKTINNNSLSPSQRGEEKNKYGTLGNVFLSNTELEELNGRLGVGKVSRLIDDLSEHMASTGKTYLSHYATLLRWSKNEYAPRDECEVSGNVSPGRGSEGLETSTSRDEENAKTHFGRGGKDLAVRSDGWDFANKKCPRDKPREPKSRYGDFDPEEAMRLAIERTMRECGGG
ncbi:MAG: phage replisome organizer N-terminal domain-containing protein [Clostridia bacterium]|nr:phage replisome organizer N-terminal domain-containing protein [Clostridia bacterium]